MKHPYKLEFTLDGLPETTNSIGRKHWAVKAKEAKTWKARVGYLARKHGLPKKPIKHAHLTLIRFSAKSPDPDGLVSSFKHVIDGLVEIGVLENDKISNIGMPDYAWEKCGPKKGHIIVIVEERNDTG